MSAQVEVKPRVGSGPNPGWFAPYNNSAAVDGTVTAPRGIGDLTDAEKRTLANDPTAAWDDLLALAGEGDWWVSTALAKNPASTADILDLVADVDDRNLRAAVAGHPNTHYETLHTLLSDPRVDVQQVAAAHPALTADDQMAAAKSDHVYVQKGLLDNPNLTVAAAQQLRQSQFLWTREQMAARDNPNTL